MVGIADVRRHHVCRDADGEYRMIISHDDIISRATEDRVKTGDIGWMASQDEYLVNAIQSGPPRPLSAVDYRDVHMQFYMTGERCRLFLPVPPDYVVETPGQIKKLIWVRYGKAPDDMEYVAYLPMGRYKARIKPTTEGLWAWHIQYSSSPIETWDHGTCGVLEQAIYVCEQHWIKMVEHCFYGETTDTPFNGELYFAQ